MKVIIDNQSGFCFGVVYAINKAESILREQGHLYVLGDIVHNEQEVKRLTQMGMEVIDHGKFRQLHNTQVLIRAHGEPTETYKIAYENNIQLIDASCPVVLRLQNQIRQVYQQMKHQDGQVVIFGKSNHPEVVGLRSQTNYEAIVIQSIEDLDKIDFSRPVALFAQTTKNLKLFYQIVSEIGKRMKQTMGQEQVPFQYYDTICRQVSHRDRELQNFCKHKDVVLFVSGKKSSNGKMLYGVCKQVNPNTYFISSPEEIDFSWFSPDDTVGICGATSTPQWLMQKVKDHLKKKFYVE